MADEFEDAINAFDRDDRGIRWREYRGSISWLRLRNGALIRDGHRCRRCRARRRLEMHHIRYPDIPEHDGLDNVMILCRSHHKKEHGIPAGV